MSNYNYYHNLTALSIVGEYLAQNFYFNAILLLRIALYAVASVLSIMLCRVHGNQLAFHRNSLILLRNHNVAVTLLSVGMCCAHLFDFIRFRTYENAEDLLIRSIFCLPARSIPGSPGIVMQLSIVAMTIERCWATLRFRTYEANSGKLGVSLVIFLWFIAISGPLSILVGMDMSNGQVPYCCISERLIARTSVGLLTIAIVDAAALICLCGLLLFNKRQKARLMTASLTEKYQVHENIRSLQLMIPMIFTHTVCFLPSTALFAIYLYVNKDSYDPRFYPIFEETFNWFPIYCVLLPVVLFWKHRELRAGLWSALKFNKVHPDNNNLSHAFETEQDHHFKALVNMWTTSNENGRMFQRNRSWNSYECYYGDRAHNNIKK